MQAESNAESFCRSFLHYCQSALSSHLSYMSTISCFLGGRCSRFNCTLYSFANDPLETAAKADGRQMLVNNNAEAFCIICWSIERQPV